MSVLLLILGLLLFVSLVVVHELGHFLVARRNGVEVEEFGIGFPPTAYKKQMKSGFLFTFNWLPLGGFVKLKGEHDADKAHGTFGAASLWAKTKIMLAGVGMNTLAALLLFMVLAWAGMPVLLHNQFTIKSDTNIIFDSRKLLIDAVESGSPAASIGLKQNDEIVAAGTQSSLQNLYDEQSLVDFTSSHAGQKVELQYEHENQIKEVTVQLRSAQEVTASKNTDHPEGYLGVVPAAQGYAFQRSTWSAPIVAIGVARDFTVATFRGLGSVLKGLGSTVAGFVTNNKKARQTGQQQASSQVSGPVGIFFILKDGSALGLRFMLTIIAIISLTLAIMNVLPIPALDGGRLFVTLLFRGIKKPLTQKREEWIHGTGFAVLMALFVLITIVDVRRFF